ncbi:MAG: leucine-rich repeat domain-containing protein, partial [Lachnospiraceae bacterium]|nr:leucine-rich repeat domain-containing protein [Lachnospiraceae bacterium]
FEDCVKLLRIEIPVQIDVLEDRVFRQCRALQEVHLPKGLQKIGESAFYGCLGLKKIELPESLIDIGKMAFYRSGLREVRIPAKTEFVESLAFAKSHLQKAWISGGGQETGKHYGEDVFGDCAKLKTLVLEEGVRHIPDKLAYGCTALKRVILPQTLETVGRHALEGTAFLEQWKQCVAEKEDAVLWDGHHFEGEVRIPEYVRIVAGGAFYGNTRITEVYLPDQVQSIGAAAFKGCKVLRRVCLPAGIVSLEAEVFSGCVELEEVLQTKNCLPTWHFIGERAFYRCGKLREIRLEQAKDIGKEALFGCTALVGSAVNPALRVGENAFAGTLLGERLENGLHIMGNLVVSGASCAGELLLPESVRGIAPYAFTGNHAVSRVTFPKSMDWIGEGAFFGCSGLVKIVLSNEQELGEGLCMSEEAYLSKKKCRIDASAFEKCSALLEIDLKGIACEIGESAFAGCTALVSAQLSQVQVLGKRLFAGCVSMETCLCEKAREVQAFCFSGCKCLKDFDFACIAQIGEYAFDGCERLKYAAFQDGVCLYPHGLEDCSGLEKICLFGQRGIVDVREYALSGCTSLQQVIYLKKEYMFECYADILSEEIPEMVRLLFHSAFSCFVVEQEKSLRSYRGAASVVRIPAGIQRIEAEVFRDAVMLEQVEIPESVSYIGARAFHGTAWIARKRKESPMVVVRDMLLDGSGCVGDVIIPADIRLVCGWAFANGLEIERICFAFNQERSRYVQVGEYAFRNCMNLRELVTPDGETVQFTGLADREKELPPLAKQAVMDSLNCFKTDENGVLIECTGNISRLRLAYGITEIGEGAFQDGNLLTTITFPPTVREIGNRAFAGCKWLQEVRQAGGVTKIGANAFSGCGTLRFVELSENLQQIGARAFENCTSLEEIQIPEGVEEIPERAFYRCHNLRNIQLPSTLKRIGREAFAFCSGASDIQVPEGVQVEVRKK